MQKNLYYNVVFRRQNIVKKVVLDLFLALASYPRILLEVFIRKNFGERYFKLSSALTAAAVTLLVSNFFIYLQVSMALSGSRMNYDRLLSINDSKTSWYLFVGIFLVFAVWRWWENKRSPSTFDFGRFSLSTGLINPLFIKVQLSIQKLINSKRPEANIRFIETILEPSAFFILGFLLYLFNVPIGVFLMVCAIFYSFSYLAAYMHGDDFVLDKIDEIIMNEETENSFINDVDDGKTRGVRFYSDKPTSKDMRRKVAETFVSETEDDTPDAF